MQKGLDAKSVRFDVYTKDDKRIFDIEIQTTNQKNLPRRARYYQSIIDMDNLSHGEKYSQLKDSYIIFFCLSDPFDEKLPMYFFENTCRFGQRRNLDDGAYKLFFNASEYAKMETVEEKNFFKFLSGQKADGDFTKAIEEKVIFARKNMVASFCVFPWSGKWELCDQVKTWRASLACDEEKDIAFEEGREEGREEGLAEAIRQIMESLHVSLVQAMDILKIDSEKRSKYTAMEELINKQVL